MLYVSMRVPDKWKLLSCFDVLLTEGDPDDSVVALSSGPRGAERRSNIPVMENYWLSGKLGA